MNLSKIVILIFIYLVIPLSLNAAIRIDAIQRQVELPDKPQRIVSLVPSVTEVLFALGLEKQIVGVTSFCTYPKQARSKPQVGGYPNPNLEAILEQHPDLVFLAADPATPTLLARMEDLGLPVYVVYPQGVQATIEMIRTLGQVTGVPANGEKLAQQLATTVATVKTLVTGQSHPRVLFCIMVHPLTVAGPRTLVGDLLETAGAENVVADGVNRYPTWGTEALLLADPDLIVVSPNSNTPNPAELFAAWPELQAVRNKHIISVVSDWVHRPGPRLGLGLLSLTAAIHDLDLSALIASEQQ